MVDNRNFDKEKCLINFVFDCCELLWLVCHCCVLASKISGCRGTIEDVVSCYKTRTGKSTAQLKTGEIVTDPTTSIQSSCIGKQANSEKLCPPTTLCLSLNI